MGVLKRIYLVRHSPAAWLETKPCYRGWSDAALSASGVGEAERVAGYFSRLRSRGGSGLSVVYSSDLSRASQTAQAIALVTESRVHIREGFREISFGAWEGRSHEDLMLEGSRTYHDWLEDPFSVSPPGGEGFPEFSQRVRGAFRRILDKGFDESKESKESGRGDEEVAVVGHGGSLRVILCDLLGMPDENHWRIRLDRSSITLVEFSGDLPVLRSMNDLSHLDHSPLPRNSARS